MDAQHPDFAGAGEGALHGAITRIKGDEAALVQAMHELVRRHPRFGYRRIHALLRRDGWSGGRVNRKRVHRLWQQEKLKVPQKQRKKR